MQESIIFELLQCPSRCAARFQRKLLSAPARSCPAVPFTLVEKRCRVGSRHSAIRRTANETLSPKVVYQEILAREGDRTNSSKPFVERTPGLVVGQLA